MRFPFRKVEGLGNDFLLFDGRQTPLPLTAASVVGLCDRHHGVGADGVLVLTPDPAGVAAARLEIWNRDGSQAEMCGNGLRCAAQALFDEGERELSIATAAGLHRCRSTKGGECWVELVGVRLAAPETLALDGEALRGRRVWLGNPHLVLFDAGPPSRAGILGPALERDPRFAPERTNVEVCVEVDGQLEVGVWERGAGLTLACGTGAAAAALAAWADGRLPRAPTRVKLPGGTLTVDPLAADRVGLAGPARIVFAGSVDVNGAGY